MKLTEKQIDQYHHEGYTILGKILSDSQIEALRQEEKRFREFKEDWKPECKNELTLFASQMAHYSAPIRQVMMEAGHIEALAQILGPNIVAWFVQFVSKRPDRNLNKSEFPWHQDNGYVSIEPATNVTVWVPLDDVNEENGCVWVSPGSHKKGLLPHGKKSEESWHLEVPVEGDGIPAILKAGEAVIFSGLTLHRSKLNKTERIRRAFFMEYAEAGAVTAHDKKLCAYAESAFMVCGEAPLRKELITWM